MVILIKHHPYSISSKEDTMLVFGTLEALRSIGKEKSFFVLNFNTMLENCQPLHYLNPYRFNQYAYNTNCIEFDMWYVDYIGNTPAAFKEFISLMRNVYNGYDVWVLVDFSTETATNVIETLIKYILEQYGYVSNVVHTPDDLCNLVEGEFSPIGIQMLDAHMENYLQYFGPKGLQTDPE